MMNQIFQFHKERERERAERRSRKKRELRYVEALCLRPLARRGDEGWVTKLAAAVLGQGNLAEMLWDRVLTAEVLIYLYSFRIGIFFFCLKFDWVISL